MAYILSLSKKYYFGHSHMAKFNIPESTRFILNFHHVNIHFRSSQFKIIDKQSKSEHARNRMIMNCEL